jgi:hypothetical protein
MVDEKKVREVVQNLQDEASSTLPTNEVVGTPTDNVGAATSTPEATTTPEVAPEQGVEASSTP